MIQGIKIKKLHENRAGKGMLNSDTYGVGQASVEFAKGLDKAYTRMNSESKDDLSIVLSNKLALARPAFERRDTIFGDFINGLYVEHPEYIHISGIELFTITSLIFENIEFPIYGNGQYLVPFRIAEEMLYKLKRNSDGIRKSRACKTNGPVAKAMPEMALNKSFVISNRQLYILVPFLSWVFFAVFFDSIKPYLEEIETESTRSNITLIASIAYFLVTGCGPVVVLYWISKRVNRDTK